MINKILYTDCFIKKNILFIGNKKNHFNNFKKVSFKKLHCNTIYQGSPKVQTTARGPDTALEQILIGPRPP